MRGEAVESLVSGGCIVSGAVFRSVLLPYVQVRRGARLTRTVVDRGCLIPNGMVIGEDATLDAERFHRSANGICLVTRDMLAKLGA